MSTKIEIQKGRWLINGRLTYERTEAEGLLMNVRMANVAFEDQTWPLFDPETNTTQFIGSIPRYEEEGIRAFTVCLQGGFPGYEGAVNSAFAAEGSLRASYMARVERIIRACDDQGVVVILCCYYRRQDHLLKDQAAVQRGIVEVVEWLKEKRFTNVLLEVANEFGHPGYCHPLLKSSEGIRDLILLARKYHSDLFIGSSRQSHRFPYPVEVAEVSDFILFHLNQASPEKISSIILSLKKYGKPLVCNEDAKMGEEGATVAGICVKHQVSWGYMHPTLNQKFPGARTGKLQFCGRDDDPIVYQALRRKTCESSSG